MSSGFDKKIVSITDIIENKVHKTLIKTVDITGREINSNTKQNISLKIYDNGTVEKQYVIK